MRSGRNVDIRWLPVIGLVQADRRHAAACRLHKAACESRQHDEALRLFAETKRRHNDFNGVLAFNLAILVAAFIALALIA